MLENFIKFILFLKSTFRRIIGLLDTSLFYLFFEKIEMNYYSLGLFRCFLQSNHMCEQILPETFCIYFGSEGFKCVKGIFINKEESYGETAYICKIRNIFFIILGNKIIYPRFLLSRDSILKDFYADLENKNNTDKSYFINKFYCCPAVYLVQNDITHIPQVDKISILEQVNLERGIKRYYLDEEKKRILDSFTTWVNHEVFYREKDLPFYRSLFIIGEYGSGKTVFAKHLASVLGSVFIQFDFLNFNDSLVLTLQQDLLHPNFKSALEISGSFIIYFNKLDYFFNVEESVDTEVSFEAFLKLVRSIKDIHFIILIFSISDITKVSKKLFSVLNNYSDYVNILPREVDGKFMYFTEEYISYMVGGMR